MGRVIDRGLAADGRLIQFEVAISDRPGGLAAFTKLIAETGARHSFFSVLLIIKKN